MSTNHLLNNRYRIVREIAQGSMGVVYEAFDEKANKRVALKDCFRNDAEAYKQAVKRSLLARLKHSSLPEIMPAFKENRRLYLVMEYIEGDNLAELLAKQKGPFPRTQVLQWADQLLELLSYLHGRAVFDCDIMPANLIIKSERIVLLDFGLMESGVSQSSDPRVDLYALSETLYQLLTNKQPEEAWLRKQASELGLSDPLEAANHLNPDIPLALADVIAQGMALEPDKCPATAKEMQALLKEAKEGWEEKLKLFRQALASKDDKRIVAAYEAHLDPELMPSEREQWQEASQVMTLLEWIDEAIRQGNEQTLLMLSDEMMAIRPVTILTEVQREYINLAQERKAEKLKPFRQALWNQDDKRIVATYEAHLDPELTPSEREQWQEASQVIRLLDGMDEAIRQGDEQAILRLSRQMPIRPFTTFSEAQRAHIRDARLRQAALVRFEKALESENDSKIIASYDVQRLEGYQAVSSKQMERLEQAKKRQAALQEFREALQSQEEQSIVQAYQPQWLDSYDELLPSEREELKRVRAYLSMLERVRKAIDKEDDAEILQAIDHSLVPSWRGLTETELARLKLAQQRQVAFYFFKKSLEGKDYHQIISSYNPLLDGSNLLQPSHRQQLQEARKQSEIWRSFRDVLWGKNSPVQDIVKFYDRLSDEDKKKLLPAEQERVEVAKKELQKKAPHRQHKN